MDGYINVKVDFGAIGDGCADDTKAIQNALDALRVSLPAVACTEPAPTGCGPAHTQSWPEQPAGLFFPPGIYNVCGPVRGGNLRNVRIFGTGGRGGRVGVGPDGAPVGSVLRQTRDGAPIFVFSGPESSGVTVERLGFTWRNRQVEPVGWSFREDLKSAMPPGYTDPGAVAILFTGSGGDDNFAHWRLTELNIEYGWRGIAIDDTYAQGIIAVFDTQIDHAQFSQLRGSAISLVNRSGFVIGMTSNSIRDVFVENYNAVNSANVVTFFSENVDDQIRLLAQACCSLDNVDLEGSKVRVLSATDCLLTINNLYLEHVEIASPYPRMIYFGGGRYVVQGMNVDGLIDAQKDSFNNNTFATLINAEHGADVVVAGVQAKPFPSTNNPGRDVDRTGGFLPLRGPAFLFGGADATYRVLDRPSLPVYQSGDRGTVEYKRGTTGPVETLTYRELGTWSDEWGQRMTAVVRVPPAKASRNLAAIPVPAGQVVTVALAPGGTGELGPVVGARIGDVVAFGPPVIPAEIVVTAVVTASNKVEIRLVNPTGGSLTAPAGRWTLTVGGGEASGAPQLLPQEPIID